MRVRTEAGWSRLRGGESVSATIEQLEPLLIEGNAGAGKTEGALHIRCQETVRWSAREEEARIFSEEFLLRRPLLKAIRHR